MVYASVIVSQRLLELLQQWFVRARARARADRGQATAEYALVLLGAAGVALILVTWAARSGRITGLLDSVIDRITGQL